ncbi:MAG: gliding motility-associated C-terminal domain-containing protein [Bacteroidetes bacterium]|nr:MAG: gliding motility-associated C-terminal domain-containing protein [Bacteroidota bacterium]
MRWGGWLLGLAFAQTLSNWGEVVRVLPATTVSVFGSVTNRQGGLWYHSGALYITDTLDNQAGNEMFRATFPDNTPVSPGKVQLWGAYQWITGSDPIYFDTLELRGTSSKNLDQEAYVRHWLDLGDRLLNTHAETLFHLNTDPGSVVRGVGFVRSGLGGALVRHCLSGTRYLYPLGDSVPVVRYRPFYLTPTGSGPYAGRFAAVDATLEGYDRTQKDPRLCLINPDFFHHVSGATGGLLELGYDPAQDGAYDAAAHWNGTQWDSVGGTPIGMGSLTFMTQAVAALTPTPFALAVRQPTGQIVPPGPLPLCPGDSVQLVVQPVNPTWTYTWSHGATGPSVWVNSPGTYTVTIEAPLGCRFTPAPVVVEALPAPSVAISPISPAQICPGDTLWLTATPALAYQWFYEGLPILGATGPTLPATQPGTYSVQGVQTCGTAESAPFLLSWHPKPQAYFVTQPPDSIEVGQPLLLIDSTRGGSAWLWVIPPDTLPGSPTLTYAFSQEGLYTLLLISQNAQGCRDTFTRTVYVRPFSGIYVPTAFTPNGDGVNDFFEIVAPPLAWSRLRLYSRWGLLIREIVGYPRWDGYDAQGNPVPEDVYTFVFEARLYSGQTLQRSGTVTVLR